MRVWVRSAQAETLATRMAISSLLVAGLAVAFQFVSTLAAPRNSEDDARVDASSTSYCVSDDWP